MLTLGIIAFIVGIALSSLAEGKPAKIVGTILTVTGLMMALSTVL